MKFKYDNSKGFRENSRRFHKKITPLFTNNNLFKAFLLWLYLEPAILEATNVKMISGLVSEHSPGYRKLSDFSKRKDVVLSILKREIMDHLGRIVKGTAITNLTSLDFTRRYGTLELERLIKNPWSGSPLAYVNPVVGAVACAGKLSLIVEYAEEAVETETMNNIKAQAMEFLLSG